MDSPMFWGTLLEPYVAVVYQQKTDHKVRKINAVLQHPTFNFMLANIDREVVGCPEVQILECKTAGEFGSRLWRDGVPERSEEHTSELQSLMRISYAVFCLKKKKEN